MWKSAAAWACARLPSCQFMAGAGSMEFWKCFRPCPGPLPNRILLFLSNSRPWRNGHAPAAARCFADAPQASVGSSWQSRHGPLACCPPPIVSATWLSPHGIGQPIPTVGFGRDRSGGNRVDGAGHLAGMARCRMKRGKSHAAPPASVAAPTVQLLPDRAAISRSIRSGSMIPA